MAEDATGTVIAASTRLPPWMVRAMLEHARAAAPRECCGLILYDREGVAVDLHRTTNINPDPDQFTVDPQAHYRILMGAEERGQRIGAVYHSHPHGPPQPSEVDRAAGLDPGWLSFIVGRTLTGGWEVRTYRLR